MQEAPGAADMRRLITGFSVTIAISAAAELGIADHLANGPKTASELARLSGTNEGFLRRVLRYLASEGVFEERDGDIFVLTDRSYWLRSDVSGSMRPRAVFTGSEMSWRAWGSLAQCTKAGISGFEVAFGEPIFDYLKTHSNEAAIFNAFMAANTAASLEAVLASYSFAGVRELVDVGGGRGALVAGVLQANPAMRGILFDMPEVVASAAPLLRQASVADRCKIVGGDFFESVPSGSDFYVLKFILHDWSDDQCTAILRNCRRAMAPDGKILIVEYVVPDESGPHVSKFMDINMLVNTSGRERTEREFEQLLASADLKLRQLAPTSIGLSTLECVAS